jgi:hypothetical protein
MTQDNLMALDNAVGLEVETFWMQYWLSVFLPRLFKSLSFTDI